jgi:acetyl-CoA acetyltransferase
MNPIGEKNVAISGIGLSQVSRAAARTPLGLTMDACTQAIADAGLTSSDIDGVACFPGTNNDDSGLSPVGVPVLQDAMRLSLNWYSGGPDAPGQLGAIFHAIAAICAGYCRHVLVYRTVYESTARKQQSNANGMFNAGGRARGHISEWAPYHVFVPAQVQALYFQKYVDTFSVRPEQVGAMVVNTRHNAGLNPDAVYRDPLSLGQYLASPFISTPLRLYDCDVPCDGSAAFVLSRKDIARDLRNPVIAIEAIGSALAGRNSWSQLRILETEAIRSCAAMMWSHTDFKPDDVQVAQLYDGFSYHTLICLEALGLCGRGEAAAFVEDPANIGLGGRLPLNTGGGQLSAGRIHGYGLLHEACVQLWNRGADRQVAGDPKVSLNCTSGGPLAGSMLLVRD